MLLALLLSVVPVVPDTDGVSAAFSVRHPEIGQAYEILVPKPDPLRGCTGVRITYDHESSVYAEAHAQIGDHPGGSYSIAPRYWIHPEPDPSVLPLDAFQPWYGGVMPPLAEGESWAAQLTGSHPTTHDVHATRIRHFQKRAGVVKLYLVPAQTGFWPGSHHGFTWGHAVSHDLQAGLVEYRSVSGNWYVP